MNQCSSAPWGSCIIQYVLKAVIVYSTGGSTFMM